MNTNLSRILTFTLGATIGSLVTWKIVEEKYKRIADEEIESVKEYYENRLKTSIRIDSEGITLSDIDDNEILHFKNDVVSPSDVKIEYYKKEITDEEITDEEIDEMNRIVEETGYSQEDEDYIVQTEPLKEYIPPYVITPEEFGEYGNDIKSLTYYADSVLTDELGEIVSDPESVIGDALEHFGEYEDDCVHVRDENIECDYEILKYEKTFSEINKEED